MGDKLAGIVNHYNLKRQAHTLSRSSNDHFWNPFTHRWNNRSKRADTWAGGRLEEQAGNDGDGLTHAQSAPLAATTDPDSQPRSLPRDMSTTETMAGSPTDVQDTTGASTKSDSGLRNRKHDDAPDATRNSTSLQDEEKKPKGEGLIRHVEPSEPFTVGNQIQRTVLSSWINVLIVAAPVGIALNYVHSVNRIIVFVVNFIAIIPLAALLSFSTEEIALRTGETLGGLLNATFGNAVELIIAIIALKDKQFEIVRTSLIGSILSNLLLVMGFCFFFGGLRRRHQNFNEMVAQTSASLLALAVASVIVPTVFDYASKTKKSDVAGLSRGTSVILLVVYAAYLLFQLKTHQKVFSEESEKVPAKPMSGRYGLMGRSNKEEEQESISEGIDEGEEPQLHFFVALGTLAISTAIIALCAEYMVGSIDAVSEKISPEFVGLILLPIVGNAAEHATAVTVAIKDKMDLAIGVAVGSSMQVALFLIPLIVVIGWGMGFDDMTLSFDIFQVTVMFVAVLLTNYLIADGKSHWLEGWLLICLYAIIAVCAFYYPAAVETEGTQDRHF